MCCISIESESDVGTLIDIESVNMLLRCTTAYRLYTVVPRLVKFVDQLTNWYVRMNRRRLKGATGVEDCRGALTTLFSVLFAMTKVMVSGHGDQLQVFVYLLVWNDSVI